MRRLITITGPDGAGKTAVADAVVERLSAHGPVQRFHHRLRALPGSEASRQATDRPHDQVAYGRLTSLAKVAYLYLDWLVGWWRLVRPFERQGGWTVVERGWWDLAVDPARYRLQPVPGLVRLLGRLRPGRDTLVVLDGPAEVMHDRKPELPVAEIDRQLGQWRAVAARTPGAVTVDVDRPLDRVVDAVLEAIGLRVPAERWAVLRTPAHRWTLPVRSARAATHALEVHQPMRPADQMLWRGARAAAASGALARLPLVEPPELRERLARHIPPGGTVAVAHGRSASKAVGLILDRHGDPVACAKVAIDERGREKLRLEAECTERYGALLEAPLRAPRVLAAEDGCVVFEAVRWRLRSRPWVLEPELARGLGRFHARGNAPAGGLGHGDFAPWNVMRAPGAWYLIDWEDAGDGRPAFEDPFHYVVQSHGLLGRPTQEVLLDGIRLRGPFGVALRAYADGAGLDLRDLAARFDDYLERTAEVGLLPRTNLRMALHDAGEGARTAGR